VSALTIALSLSGCGGTKPPPENPQVATEASAEPAQPPRPAESGAVSASATAEPAPANKKPAEQGTPLEQLMHQHFKQAEEIRHAVVSGKLNNAVQPALSLGNTAENSDLPKAWRPSLERMRTAASRVQNSSDLAETAAGTADIGVACGSCHEGQGGPKVTVGEAPAVGTTVVSRMARHAWAMERLWEGLFVPSSAAWKAGAKALQGDPFPPEVLERGGVYGRTAAKDFKSLAAQAPAKEASKDRAALYAGLLGTCATCHLATGRATQ